MEEILDNPVWHAMRTGNRNLALIDGAVGYFPPPVGPFAGLETPEEPRSFDLLDAFLPSHAGVAIVTARKLIIPAPWKIPFQTILVQMVAPRLISVANSSIDIRALKSEHIPQMIALTRLTNPGPFLDRTIEFGSYTGIFDKDTLVAMAGHRLHPGPYVEISAVCTHPDHTGKGYGTALVLYQGAGILQQGNIPFLHTRFDNENAIRLYKSLGFSIRSEMSFCIIQR